MAFVDERTGKFELILIDATGSEKKQVVRFRGMIGGPVAWAPYQKIAVWVKAKEAGDLAVARQGVRWGADCSTACRPLKLPLLRCVPGCLSMLPALPALPFANAERREAR